MKLKGSTASLTIATEGVIKHVQNSMYMKYNVFERELFWLRRFKDVEFIPNLTDYDENSKKLYLDFVGTHLNNLNKPKDLHEQLDIILNTLKEYNCAHNDINLLNILVKDSKIYLIDFGWSTFISDDLEDNTGKYFKIISNRNDDKFPKVLNAVYRKSGKLDDEYAMHKIKNLI